MPDEIKDPPPPDEIKPPEEAPPDEYVPPKQRGGSRPGAGRPPGKKAKKKVVRKKKAPSGPKAMPDLMDALGVSDLPPDSPAAELIRAIADPFAAGALVTELVDQGAQLAGRTFLDGAEIAADEKQKEAMGAAWGLYIATLEWQPTPAQLLALAIVGCYGVNVAKYMAETNAATAAPAAETTH